MRGLPPDLPQRRPVVARAPASAAEPEAKPPPSAPPAPVLVPQTGHVSQVWSVAFHPNGRWLATGGFDHTIGIWSLDGGLLAQLVGHHEALKRVAFDAEGKRLASIARDARIIVWDLERFRALTVIEHPGFDLALSADGKKLYAVGPKAEIAVYDAASGKLLRSVTTPNAEGRQLLGIALSPDGRTLATASLDGIVHLWDEKRLTVRSKLGARTWRVAFGPDGRLAVPAGDRVLVVDAASGETRASIGVKGGAAHVAWGGGRLFAGVDKDVVVLDPDAGKVVKRFSVGILEALGVSADGTRVATGNDDPQVRLWRADTGAPELALGTPWGAVGSARFDPKGERILTTAAHWLDVWDAKRGTLLWRLRTKKPPGEAAWSPDGELVATSAGDGTVVIFDAASGGELGKVEVPTRDDWGPRFAFSPDSQRLAVFIEKRLSLWDRKLKRTIKSGSSDLSLASDVKWSGTVIAVGGSEGVALFDPDLKALAKLDVKQVVPWGRVEALAFSPDGRALLTATSQHLGLFELPSGKLVAKIDGRTLHAPPVFSPDGRAIAFPSREHGVSLWSGGRTRELLRVGSAVRQLRWSPDGKRIAVASDDSQIRVVEVATRKLLSTLSGHEARIWSLEWNPSGRVLLAASHQARLHRPSDGSSFTLRARHDRVAGIVHASDGRFDGDESLLRLRVGTELRALNPKDRSTGLLEALWR